jgi:hypothetical protein
MSDKKPNQSALILAYLQRRNTIDPGKAIAMFKCYRLAARIKELREAGHDIETTMVPHDGGEHAEYRMVRVVQEAA